MELPGELRRLRGTRTQGELATAAGVSLASVRNWEQGRNRPDLASACRLARVFGVPLDRLGELAVRDDEGAAVAPARRKGGGPGPAPARRKRGRG